METTGINRDAMLAGLHDIRLPAAAPGGTLAELLVALGLGLALAALLSLLLPVVAPRIRVRRPASLADRVAALRGLPDAERAVALLHLARTAAPEIVEAERPRLYAPGAFPDPCRLEARLLERADA